MSEYYRLRRTKISDGMALLGFILGFLIPTYAAGKRMVEGFETGQETEGLSHFVFSILGSAFIGGLIGLVLGIVVGWVWERIHRFRRSSRPEQHEEVAARSGFAPAAAEPSRSAARPRETAASQWAPVETRFRFDSTGFTALDYVALMNRVMPEDYDIGRAALALEKTTNIGAWDGERLVGAVRVLGDGYLFATIPEIVVDPDYRRQGIGRALMQRALDAASTGVILFASPPEASGFFERLGCQRAPSGYVMRHRVAPAIRTK